MYMIWWNIYHPSLLIFHLAWLQRLKKGSSDLEVYLPEWCHVSSIWITWPAIFRRISPTPKRPEHHVHSPIPVQSSGINPPVLLNLLDEWFLPKSLKVKRFVLRSTDQIVCLYMFVPFFFQQLFAKNLEVKMVKSDFFNKSFMRTAVS